MDSPRLSYVLCLTCNHKGEWSDFRGHKDRKTRSIIMSNPFNLGHLKEGTVEQDPMTDRYVIRMTGVEGKSESFDILAAFEALKGQKVKFTLVSLEDLAKLAKMVEEQGGGRVMGVGTIGGGES